MDTLLCRDFAVLAKLQSEIRQCGPERAGVLPLDAGIDFLTLKEGLTQALPWQAAGGPLQAFAARRKESFAAQNLGSIAFL